MLYGMYGLQGLNPRKNVDRSGYYGFRLRNTAPCSGWWRIVEIEFCAGKAYSGKYNGSSVAIASSARSGEPADRAYDGVLTTTGTTYGSGWGSNQSGTILGQYIGMKSDDLVPLQSTRFLTWGNPDHGVDAVALDVLVSPPGATEAWVEMASLSGTLAGSQWFGWESIG